MSKPFAVQAAVAVGYGVVVGFTRELTLAAAIAVLVPVLVLALVALRAPVTMSAPVSGRAAAPWLVLIAAVVGWEIAIWTVGNNADWPTLSMLFDPVLAQPWVRAVAGAAWLAAGWWIAVGTPVTDRPAP